jgi:hypothetical protein
VRFVFLDEGGISKHELHAVVAGVVVHGDEQLIPLERALRWLVNKHIPKEHRDGFVFHATDLWSGTGNIFGDKERWSRDSRMKILRDLARVPRKLDIPIVHEFYPRAKFADAKNSHGKKATEHEISVAAHSCAFAACSLRIDEYMQLFYPSEVAQLVAEDNAESRKMIKEVHQAFRHPHRTPGIIPSDRLPLKHIRTSVHFAHKDESAPLQIADLAAFIIRGRMSRNPRHEPYNSRLYRRLRSMMYRFVDDDENYSGPIITARPPYVAVDFEKEFEKHARTLGHSHQLEAPEQSS